MKQRTVVVIGAGMAGLAAAYSMSQEGISVTVLEKNSYIGGRIHTIDFNGYAIDTGAEFLASFYANTQRLIQELDLQKEVFRIAGGTAFSRNGRLYQLWTGPSIIFTPLISLYSKVTLLKTLFPLIQYWGILDNHAFYKSHPLDTHSIAEYASRELNDELKNYVLQSAISGIFHWSLEQTSQAMLFILLKAGINMKIFSLQHGLRELAKMMADKLSIRCNAQAKQVVMGEDGRYVIDVLIDGQMQQFNADGVVCATPATHVSALFPDLNAEQSTFFESIGYSASVSVFLGLNRRFTPSVYGVLCPSHDFKYLSTINIHSAKDPDRAPHDLDVIELTATDPTGHELLDKDDEEIQNVLRDELQHVGFCNTLKDEELPSRVIRWYQALPYFDVGHFKRLKAFAEGKIESERLVFAGDYLGGPYIEGAITSGLEAAQQLLQRLK